jgi:type III secretion protein T
VTLLFVSGGIFALFDGLYASYVLWPPATYFPHLDLSHAEFFLGQLDNLMYLIVFLAAPIIICMFVAELGLALIGRFAPQLNVFFLAMPIKSGIAIFVLAIYLYLLMEYFTSNYTAFRFIPEELYELLK